MKKPNPNVPVALFETISVHRSLRSARAVKKPCRFHTVDLNDLSEDDEHENPDWLVGAN